MRAWKKGINRSWKNEKKTNPQALKSFNPYLSPSDGCTSISREMQYHVKKEDWFNLRKLQKEKQFLIQHYTRP
jgi:hypothetical protein